ncbi:hypothetical protein S1OALGB6SA_1801 [Olavius algarvensis spirochete endosymbiont]|nr:hypothetical protein S1OALGB6SA_1801 [Olavius algarvensis spirochete endosymbiont]
MNSSKQGELPHDDSRIRLIDETEKIVPWLNEERFTCIFLRISMPKIEVPLRGGPFSSFGIS